MTESFPVPDDIATIETPAAPLDLNAVRDQARASEQPTMSLPEAFQVNGGAQGGGFRKLHLYKAAGRPGDPTDTFNLDLAQRLYT